MNNRDLDQLLKSARLPQPGEEYWHQLPNRIMQKLRLRKAPLPVLEGEAEAPRVRRLVLGSEPLFSLRQFTVLTVAILCIVSGAILLFRNRAAPEAFDSQWAAARKYYREIASLFPNQLRAIVLDQAGAHLDLAEAPTVPASPPLYLKVCDEGGCRSFITFSGQQIKLGNEVVEVFSDRRGDVLVVGLSFVWSSSDANRKRGRYRIQARALQEAS
jgi:hypothetical protein